MTVPQEEGVYAILDPNGKTIYIGCGNLYFRLMTHYHKWDPLDECIWKHHPAYFWWEKCSNSKEREEELLGEFSTLCNAKEDKPDMS